MKRRKVALLVALSLSLTLIGCGDNTQTSKNEEVVESKEETTKLVEESTTSESEQTEENVESTEENIEESVQAYFEKEGINCKEFTLGREDLEVYDTYNYMAMCKNDENRTVEGTVKMLDSRIFTSDDEHPAKDGYEWVELNVTVDFPEEVNLGLAFTDYYNRQKLNDTWDSPDGYAFVYAVDWNGQEYTEVETRFLRSSEITDDVAEYYLTVSVCRPIGYDGYVLYFQNAQLEDGEQFNDDNTLFIRLK